MCVIKYVKYKCGCKAFGGKPMVSSQCIEQEGERCKDATVGDELILKYDCPTHKSKKEDDSKVEEAFKGKGS
jgi:hypothetical protein